VSVALPTWTVRGTITRVVDGDTFDANLDLGWGIWIIKGVRSLGRIRVLGLDTPEMNTPEGVMAKAIAQELLPVGSQVWIHSHDLDNFGRSLASITLADGTDYATTIAARMSAA
jgi:endonuclease YncB( thermonuclease family)